MARASRSAEDLMSHLEALRLAGSARLQDARRTSAIAAAIAKQSRRLERAALFEAATAVWKALDGNPTAARQKVTTALAPGRGHEVEYAAAFALAVSGELSRSARLPTIWPVTIRRTRRCNSCIYRRCGLCSPWTHVMRQRLFNRCRRPPASTSPWAASASIGFFGKLYPINVRGLACLAAQQPVEAVARVPADCRPSKHRARRSHRRAGAAAAGESAFALGRHRQGEKRVRRSVCAVGERRRQDPTHQRSTGGTRPVAVSSGWFDTRCCTDHSRPVRGGHTGSP